MPWQAKGTRAAFRWSKRVRSDREAAESDAAEITDLFRDALTLQPSMSTFDMDSAIERERLASRLWATSSIAGEDSVAESNPSLAAVLETLLDNSYRPRDADAHEIRTNLRIEGIFVNLQRAQSQKKMTVLTARVSIGCKRVQMHGNMWRMMGILCPGLLASQHWTDDFVEFARELRPPCEYEPLPGVGGVMFDNYTRKVLYTSEATVEQHGYLLNMTNSASMTVPRLIAPANFDAQTLCEPPSPPLPIHYPAALCCILLTLLAPPCCTQG